MRIGGNLKDELREIKIKRGKLRNKRRIEMERSLIERGWKMRRRIVIGRKNLKRMGLKMDKILRKWIEIGKIGINIVKKRRKKLKREGIFERRRKKGEKELLKMIKKKRIKIDIENGVVDKVMRKRKNVKRIVYRIEKRIKKMGRLNGIEIKKEKKDWKRRKGR